MLNLLAEQAKVSWPSYVILGVLVVGLIATMILMNRRNKKREKESQDLMNAVKAGNKVTTIGGIVGIVVEVDPEDDCLIVETGSETHGKSYIKFIRQAIYQSDATLEKAEEKSKDEEPSQVTETATEETASLEVSSSNEDKTVSE